MQQSYEDFEDEDKININNKIASELQNLSNINGLYLDGELMLTTKTLINNDIKYNNLSIVELDESTYNKQKEELSNHENINTHNMSLKDFINNENNNNIIEKCNFIYADFMNTIVGSDHKNIFPLEDINNFLKKTKRNNILFCCTFSTRKKLSLKVSKKIPLNKVLFDAFLEPLFIRHQYKVKNLTSIKYSRYMAGSTMITYVIKLKKDLSINSGLAEFIKKRDKKTKKTKWYGYSMNEYKNNIPINN